MVIGKKKLKVRVIKDKDGAKGVFIQSEDWKNFKQEIEALKRNLNKPIKKRKESVFKDVKEALHEVALIRQGKLKPKSLKDLLREL